MGGENEINLKKTKGAEFQYHARIEGSPVNLENRPENVPSREIGRGDGMFTRTFKLYTSPENRTEKGYPRMEVKDTDIKIHDGNTFREQPSQMKEVALEVDLDGIEENPPETDDSVFDALPDGFDSPAERKKYIDLRRAVSEWHQSHPTPLGI